MLRDDFWFKLFEIGDMVLMKTARTEVQNPKETAREYARILLDSGSQRTYITQSLAKRLGVSKCKEEKIKRVIFGCDKPNIIKTYSTQLCLKLKNGEYIEISANIVPVISDNIQHRQINTSKEENIKHLLSSPYTAETFDQAEGTTTLDLLLEIAIITWILLCYRTFRLHLDSTY